ncbi:MAG: ATP-binding protein [Cyclobacteriaceae bacterium]
MLKGPIEIGNLNNIIETILANIHAAVVIVDKNLQIKSHNNAYIDNISKQLFGKEHANQVIDCMYENNQAEQCPGLPQCNTCELRNALIKVFNNKQPLKDQYFSRVMFNDGIQIKRSYSFSLHPVNYFDEEMVVLIIEDITDRKQQQVMLEIKNQELEAINEQKNKFLSIASHDLRNPIAAIQACSNLLLSSLEELVDNDQRNLLDIIFTKSQYSLNLISDLLDYSKIEAGKFNLSKQPENFENFISYIFQNYKILARQNKNNIHLNIKNKLPVISMDRNRVEQVINNLIDNAIKYSLPGKKIEISCGLEDDFLYVSVEDEGPGIPGEEIHKIFDAFHKVESSFHSKRNGSGLGLAIVKKIIEAHHGKVEVQSVFEKGSTFTIKLPVI